MSPASRIHGVIQANLAFMLMAAVRAAALPLQVLAEGAVIPASGRAEMSECPISWSHPATTGEATRPSTEPDDVEVLSPGNSDDTRDNIRAYATLASVREIAVIHTGEYSRKCIARTVTGAWQPGPELVERGRDATCKHGPRVPGRGGVRKHVVDAGTGLIRLLRRKQAGPWNCRAPSATA